MKLNDTIKRIPTLLIAAAVILLSATSCSHEPEPSGKDDGTGTIMDDGTSPHHKKDTDSISDTLK